MKKIVRCALVIVLTLGVAHANDAQSAFVFSPQGAGPHPAVVMLHGCGGAYGKDGKLNARHQM